MDSVYEGESWVLFISLEDYYTCLFSIRYVAWNLSVRSRIRKKKPVALKSYNNEFFNRY